MRPAAMIRSRNRLVSSCVGSENICLRVSFLEDLALVQEAHPVGDVAREPHLMRRDHHRHPLGRQLADRVQHLGDQHRIEGARDLVEQEDVGLHRERTHDRNALLLTAGESIGEFIGLGLQPEAAQQLIGARSRLVIAQAEHLARCKGHVLAHGHMREEVERLEHDADLAADGVLVDPARRDVETLDQDPAAVDRLQQIDAPQERRLARPACSDQTHDLVVVDGEIDATQHLELAEPLVEPFDPQGRFVHATPPACRRR